MDFTNVLMDLLVALIGILVPLVVAYVGYYAKRALSAIEAKKYSEALKDYDAALHEALYTAARVALNRAGNTADSFVESDIMPLLYRQAAEVSKAFSEKTGVRVDINEERVDALIRLSIDHARRSWEQSQRRPLGNPGSPGTPGTLPPSGI